MRFHWFRKNHLYYLRLSLSVAIILFLIKILDFERIKLILPQLRLQYVWQAAFLLLLSNFIISVRWSLLLSHFKISQPIMKSFRYYLIGGFYSIILPGSVGGDVVRLGLCLKGNNKSKAFITGSILFERTCGIMVIMMLASVATMLIPATILSVEQETVKYISVFAIIILCVYLLFFVTLKTIPHRWFCKINSTKKCKNTFYLLLDGFRNLTLGSLISVLSLSCFAHFCDIIGSYFLARSLHIDQPLSIFFLIIPIVYVLTILPVSIGGIGVREGVLSYFLMKVGVLPSDAVLLAVFIYLNRVLVGLIGGFSQLKFRKHQL